ncbi:MAG: hypothetical protein ACOY3P_25690 [Planctomycetota bacterium]
MIDLVQSMPLWAANNVLAGVAIAVLGLMIFLLLSRTHRRSGRQPSSAAGEPRITRQPQGLRVEPHGQPSAAVQAEVELHELARRLTGELDSRMRALQAITAEADRAAARLEAALAAAEQATERAAAEGSSALSTGPDATEPPTGHQADALRTADRTVAPTAGTEISPPTTAYRPRDQIYILADYGYPSAEIAQRVGMPVGEVELILGLREQAAEPHPGLQSPTGSK